MGWPINTDWKGCKSIECWTHVVISTFTSPMTLTLDFQGQILEMLYLRNGMADCHGTKGMWVDRMLDLCCDFQRSPQPWLWIFKAKFLSSYIEQCEGPSTSNERNMSWLGVMPTMWPTAMAFILEFQGQIFKTLYLRNGRAHSHGMKGMWVDGILDSHCDFRLWPHPWPWPWIFKVKYWNCCISGMGWSTHLEWKGCELDMMLDAQWGWPWATVHGK